MLFEVAFNEIVIMCVMLIIILIELIVFLCLCVYDLKLCCSETKYRYRNLDNQILQEIDTERNMTYNLIH